MLRPQTQAASVERFEQAQRDLLVLFCRHKKKPPCARLPGELTNVHAPHDGTDRRPPHPRRPYSPKCLEGEFYEVRLAPANPFELSGSSRPDRQKALLSSVGFCDGLQVHATPLPYGAGRLRRLPRVGEHGRLRTARAHLEAHVLAHPKSWSLACPEGLAPAKDYARTSEGRVGLPLAPRPKPGRRGGDGAGARHLSWLHPPRLEGGRRRAWPDDRRRPGAARVV